MKQNCTSCKKMFDTQEKLCRDCYELVIFRGQCLNIAGLLLKDKWNPEVEEFNKKLFSLAKKIYEDGRGGGWK